MSEPVALSGELPPPTPRESTAGAVLAVGAAAFLFGTTFLVMQDAVEDAGPVPFIAVRFGIGALVLAPFAARRRSPTPGSTRAGVLAGLALTVGYVLQTTGLQYTESSVSAFITYLLLVFVPIMSAVVLRRVPSPTMLAGIVLAIGGLVLLTGGGVGFGRGEWLTLGCAVSFAAHIVLLSEFAPRFDVTRLNFIQVAVVAGALAGPGLVLGGYRFPASVWLAALYTGVAVTAGAFALQVWGQRLLGATRTALILTLEPVFAAALGYAAGERLGLAGTLGAVLILAGILLAESSNLLTHRSTSREPDAGG